MVIHHRRPGSPQASWRHPNLAVYDGCHPSPLYLIAQQPSAFPSEARFSFLERFISRICFANVPVKLEISSNVGDGGDVESLIESPVGSAEGRH
ncbi:hypothetical protein RHGRI_020093 [Rhododendron griersonianum]|uniref:Uncharacterized protein n=1 Tax=Rhododendron griersonianum TaxID=479676 RepID=A0AAV6JJP0_9ERIC|nr:hypothetical protein RHGRI_020093 [Rhododendron griersonianum]